MTTILIRTDEQIDRLAADLKVQRRKHVALSVSYDRLKPPMTTGQRKRLFAMARDLAVFTGEEYIIENVLMPTDLWPKEEHCGGVTIHFDKTTNTERLYKTKGSVRPTRVSRLSKDEISLIIELMFRLGANMDGFEWSDPSEHAA